MCLNWSIVFNQEIAKEPRTIETLKAYLLQNLFAIESDQLTPRGVSREALFIPLGWDTDKRIQLLKEGPELPTNIVAPRQRYAHSIQQKS